MQERDNLQRREIHQQKSHSERLAEIFAQYEKLIQQGHRFFSDWNDECLYDGTNDDDADCNQANLE